MSHHYGAAGADYRKISSSHFIFDFPLCNHLASPEIREKIKNKLEDFKKKIILAKKKGNLRIKFFLVNFTANAYTFFCIEGSGSTIKTQCSSFPVARISTKDPSVAITLSLEV
jgi:hypothetical protein